jgi:hypothetical protein
MSFTARALASEVVPTAGAGDAAVQQDERRAATRLVVVELEGAGLDVPARALFGEFAGCGGHVSVSWGSCLSATIIKKEAAAATSFSGFRSRVYAPLFIVVAASRAATAVGADAGSTLTTWDSPFISEAQA